MFWAGVSKGSLCLYIQSLQNLPHMVDVHLDMGLSRAREQPDPGLKCGIFIKRRAFEHGNMCLAVKLFLGQGCCKVGDAFVFLLDL